MDDEEMNNNNMDLEWEEPNNVEDQQDEPNAEEDDQIPRNADGTMDGGVAGITDSSKEPDLMLFLECSEVIDGHEDNPVLTPEATVCIGLEKSTKLGVVFERYVSFANDHALETNQNLLRMDDLEFLHCTILRASDTSEVSALMKNDKIRVQKSKRDERALEAESKLLQREADQHYFENLRGLMTDLTGSCDILLDCQGKLVDENGLNQEVLRTTLRGHSALLSKRCEWLGNLIRKARDDLGRRSVVTIPDQDADMMKDDMPDTINNQGPLAESDDGDEGIAALPYPAEAHDSSKIQGVAEIENDDEEEEPESFAYISRPGSPVVLSSASRNMLWVTIPNHPPEAVKILLEYCYTNSVIPLGQHAFEVAWHTPDDEKISPLRPLSRQWSDGKQPRVSFATALAGIALAEEAKLPRLSLMCEVASSHLVESSNVVEALSMCTRQEELTGNSLSRLRKVAMSYVLRRRGVEQLSRTQAFERAMGDSERSAVLVPSLLVGTMEAMVAYKKKHESTTSKEVELSLRMQERFTELDKEDTYHRDMERRKYRSARHSNPLFLPEDEPTKSACVSKKSHPSKKSLKRSSHSSWGHSHLQRKHSRKHKKSSRR